MSAERFVTLTEIARRVNMSRYTIRQEIAAGRLDAIRFGSRGDFRISEDAYQRWLATFDPGALAPTGRQA